jgi:hypothetical protein
LLMFCNCEKVYLIIDIIITRLCTLPGARERRRKERWKSPPRPWDEKTRAAQNALNLFILRYSAFVAP